MADEDRPALNPTDWTLALPEGVFTLRSGPMTVAPGVAENIDIEQVPTIDFSLPATPPSDAFVTATLTFGELDPLPVFLASCVTCRGLLVASATVFMWCECESWSTPVSEVLRWL